MRKQHGPPLRSGHRTYVARIEDGGSWGDEAEDAGWDDEVNPPTRNAAATAEGEPPEEPAA